MKVFISIYTILSGGFSRKTVANKWYGFYASIYLKHNKL